MSSVAKKSVIFLGLWLGLLAVNQLLFEEGSLSLASLGYSLPHTFIFTVVLFFGVPWAKKRLTSRELKTLFKQGGKSEEKLEQERWEKAFAQSFAEAYPDLDEKGAHKRQAAPVQMTAVREAADFNEDERIVAGASASFGHGGGRTPQAVAAPASEVHTQNSGAKDRTAMPEQGQTASGEDLKKSAADSLAAASAERAGNAEVRSRPAEPVRQPAVKSSPAKPERRADSSAGGEASAAAASHPPRQAAARLSAGLDEGEFKYLPFVVIAAPRTAQGCELFALSVEYGFVVRLIADTADGLFAEWELLTADQKPLQHLELISAAVSGRSHIIKSVEDLLVKHDAPLRFFKAMDLCELLELIKARGTESLNRYPEILGGSAPYLTLEEIPRGGCDHSVELVCITDLKLRSGRIREGLITQADFTYLGRPYQGFAVLDPNFAGLNLELSEAAAVIALAREADEDGIYHKYLAAILRIDDKARELLKTML